MSYDRRTRDRFRVVVTGVTGGVGVAALTATGLLMGLASRDMADQQAEQQAQQPAKQPAQQQTKQHAKSGKNVHKPRLRQRPQVTRTTVRYVTGDSNQVGSGGAVTTGSGSAPQSPAQPAPQPAPAPAPAPAPEPAPAPSSGS